MFLFLKNKWIVFIIECITNTQYYMIEECKNFCGTYNKCTPAEY